MKFQILQKNQKFYFIFFKMKGTWRMARKGTSRFFKIKIGIQNIIKN